MKQNNRVINNKEIKIPNYLKIFKEDSRCVVCLIDHKSISKNFLDKYDVNELSKYLNISPRTVYYWLKEERPISINKIFELEKLFERNLSLEYYKICKYTSINGVKNKTILPKKLDIRLSYLVGYIFGDGYINIKGKNKRSFPFGLIDGSERNIKIATYLLKKIFNLNTGYSFRKDKNCYELAASWKIGVIILNKIFNMPLGYKHPNLDMPQMIKNSNQSIKLAFILGFLSADFGGNSLTQASYNIIKEVEKELKKIKIKCCLYGPYGPYKKGELSKWVLYFPKKSQEEVNAYIWGLQKKLMRE